METRLQMRKGGISHKRNSCKYHDKSGSQPSCRQDADLLQGLSTKVEITNHPNHASLQSKHKVREDLTYIYSNINCPAKIYSNMSTSTSLHRIDWLTSTPTSSDQSRSSPMRIFLPSRQIDWPMFTSQSTWSRFSQKRHSDHFLPYK